MISASPQSFDERGTPDIAAHVDAWARGDRPSVAYTVADMADDIAALLRHLHVEMAHSVGASLGGMIGRWFAVRHPQRCLPLTAVMTGYFPVPGGPAVPPLGERAAANMRTKTDHLERAAAADACVSAWRSDSGSAVPFDEDLARACGEHTDDRAYHPAGAGAPGA